MSKHLVIVADVVSECIAFSEAPRQRTSKTLTLKILKRSKWDSKASVLDACYTYFLYLSIGLHASMFVGICWEF
jgi:hypothetical protein